jgi:uncharacterized NAD(P)/FAD-binding protein YdhS
MRAMDDPAPEPLPALTVAIVGAGFSGTMTAIQLLRQARPGRHLQLVLIERSDAWARGIAYASTSAPLLLNVPARGMSAFPDRPDHFVEWLRPRRPGSGPETFARRSDYGHYLAGILASTTEAAHAPTLERVRSEVVGFSARRGGAALALADGRTVEADRVVLALGNFPPSDPPVADPSFYRDRRYIGSPWSPAALDEIADDAPVLLIGTGLTMFDIVVALADRGHHAPIHVLSRRGLVPNVHRIAAAGCASTFDPTRVTPGVLPLMRAMRAEARAREAAGCDWRSVMDSIRPRIQALWVSLPNDERRRFLRHARPYWEIHRHRLPPEILDVFEEARRAGRVTVHAGSLASFAVDPDGVEVRISLRGGRGERAIHVGRVINCTGPTSTFRKLEHPLIRDLFAGGHARPDPLHLGLDTADDGALLDHGGRPSEILFTIGPARKGALWETTAVPELREQARNLAARLLA